MRATEKRGTKINTVRIGPVYVRADHGRLISIDTSPKTTVGWLTARALIALDDPRDASQCRLAHKGETLNPRRTLNASNIRPGDTLDLIAESDASNPRRFVGLRHVLGLRRHRD